MFLFPQVFKGSIITRLSFFLMRLALALFQVDEILKDGQVLPVFKGLRVTETPGHPGHISLSAAEAGILFCDDSMVTFDNHIDDDPQPVATKDQT